MYCVLKGWRGWCLAVVRVYLCMYNNPFYFHNINYYFFVALSSWHSMHFYGFTIGIGCCLDYIVISLVSLLRFMLPSWRKKEHEWLAAVDQCCIGAIYCWFVTIHVALVWLLRPLTSTSGSYSHSNQWIKVHEAAINPNLNPVLLPMLCW